MAPPRIIGAGGGSAGREAAQRRAGAAGAVLRIDRQRHPRVLPLLCQVAAAAPAPDAVARPIRPVRRASGPAAAMPRRAAPVAVPAGGLRRRIVAQTGARSCRARHYGAQVILAAATPAPQRDGQPAGREMAA